MATWDVEALKKAIQGIDPKAAEEALAGLAKWGRPRLGQSVALVGGVRRGAGRAPTHKRPPPRSSGGRRTPKKGAP